MSKYSIKEIDASEADVVWQESPQATIFTKPDVLQELAHEVHWWGVFKTEELRCVWPVALNEKNQPCIVAFAYWQGPIWAKDTFNQAQHRVLSLNTSVYELFIKKFIDKYKGVKASLHPTLLDVRVFDWWNYHSTNKSRFIIEPRYTAQLSNLKRKISEIEKDFRRDRRRDLKLSKETSELTYFDSSCKEVELVSLYCDTLEIESKNVENSLISLLKLVDRGFGWIQSVRKKSDSTLCGLMIILQDKHQANLVINIATPEFKSNRLMAHSILKAIETSKEKGLQYFDFNGANSPNRGDDKHSYGARPVLYFDISLTI